MGEKPFYKNQLQREYLVKWTGRSFRHVNLRSRLRDATDSTLGYMGPTRLAARDVINRRKAQALP